MSIGLVEVNARFWRILAPRWQCEPLSGNGAATRSGRWNRPGCPALYTSADHTTAVAEYHQAAVRPGMLAAFDVTSASIADLTDRMTLDRLAIDAALPFIDWRADFFEEARDPATWSLVDRLLDLEAHGALVPSIQRDGINLVLWRWSADGSIGATVTLVDPYGDLA